MLALSIGAATPGLAEEARETAIANTIKKSRDLIERGRDQEVAGLLGPILSDPTTPTDLMALAFFFRGVANDRQKLPDAALADLGNALWFGVLPQPLRAQAHVRRASALMQLGRLSEAKGEVAAAQALAPSDQQIAQAVEAIERTPPAVAQSVLSKAPADRQETTGSLGSGRDFSIQLAALANERAARGEWNRLNAGFADLLAGLEPRYVQRGQFTRLLVGPLPSFQASVDLCARLKQRGQDCFAVTP